MSAVLNSPRDATEVGAVLVARLPDAAHGDASTAAHFYDWAVASLGQVAEVGPVLFSHMATVGVSNARTSELIRCAVRALEMAEDSALAMPALSIALGTVMWVPSPSGAQPVGDAMNRALTLSEQAAPGHLLVDVDALHVVSPTSISSRAGVQRGWQAADYMGGTRTVRQLPGQPPLHYRELRWSSAPLQAQMSSRRVTQTAKLRRWMSDRRHGFLVDDVGQEFFLQARHLVSGKPPPEGTRIFFIQQPAIQTGGRPLAVAAMSLGETLEGRVASVRNDAAWIEVSDRAGQLHQLRAERPHEDLVVDDLVSFQVAETGSGLRAAGATLTHRLVADSRLVAEPPVALRFINSLTLQLRRQGAAGAAQAVLRRASNEWVPMRPASDLRARQEVYVLVNHALHDWGYKALDAVGDWASREGLRSLGSVFDADSAACAEAMIGEYRTRLRAQLDVQEGGPIKRSDVLGILGEIQLCLRHAAHIQDGPLSEPAKLAVEHAGIALALAFGCGIVTSAPGAAGDALAALSGA